MVHHGGLHDDELDALGVRPHDLVDLSSNVNPYGPHPEVLAAVRSVDVGRYPDPTGLRTRRVLAEHAGVSVDSVVLGAGAAPLMWDLARATIRSGDVAVVPRPCFGEYVPALRAAGATVVDELVPGAATGWVGCPDNPGGRLLSTDDEARWARDVDLAVFDHAFLSLTPAAGRPWLPGTVSLRSITKDHAIPGVRAGWAIVPPELAARIESGRAPWATSTPARAALEASVRHDDWVEACRLRLAGDRDALVAGLRRLGFAPEVTDTVWILLPVEDAPAFRKRLLPHGVVVRDCSSFGLPDRVRVRCGPGQERLLSALGEEAPSTARSGVVLERPDLLVVRLGGDLRVLSHAMIGGGITRARSIAIVGLRNADLPEGVNADAVVRARLPLGAVGMATSRNVSAYRTATRDGVLAVATVGLSNRLRSGDSAGGGGGTINVVVRIPWVLSDVGLTEALAVAAEARTLAVREANLRSVVSGGFASGTGTDCLAVACIDGASPADFAGMHTAAGSAVGGAVYEAVKAGIDDWIAQFIEGVETK